MCAPSEPPNVSVIFVLRGPERDCDNCTLHNGSIYWKVQGNASSCQLTVFNAQGSDSGDYGNFTCMYTHVEEFEIPDNSESHQLFLKVTLPITIFLSLVLVILVVLLFTFARKLYRKRKKRLLDPPGKIFQSSTSLFSLICTITLADCVYIRNNRNCPGTHS